MNDRFKFRVFEKPTKIMHELNAVGYSDFDPTGQGISHLIMIPAGIQNTYAYNKTCLYNPDNFSKPMQCTGLKDKNGKLIYEGDIVYKKGNKDHKGNKMFSTVVWDSMYAEFNISDENGLHRMPTNSNNIEVIGNIYENPELLKVQND